MANAEFGGALDVEVIYSLPTEQALLRLRVAAGTTAGQAIELAGLLARYPELETATLHIGIFGKFVAWNTVLKTGDRVEIYRPLIVDPKDARRRRVSLKKSNKTNT